ncbi:hypothetical protein C8F04DRAFT_169895 [Mycena alexandri]|uniref:Secreted protein n=1 Tax=Mycena alexandri TaxID=1745969 RepID=A0AAD6T9V0_9AGAR|nr:hypothetical protein C8F04DRAFT_169895 [Mycena alexandri]
MLIQTSSLTLLSFLVTISLTGRRGLTAGLLPPFYRITCKFLKLKARCPSPQSQALKPRIQTASKFCSRQNQVKIPSVKTGMPSCRSIQNFKTPRQLRITPAHLEAELERRIWMEV